MKKNDYLEFRIFACFVLVILYVHYIVLVNKEHRLDTVQILKEKTLEGFEVRIINDYANERLELTDTLGQALSYIDEYRDHHEDLVAFDLSTGARVGSSADGNGVIYSETLSTAQ